MATELSVLNPYPKRLPGPSLLHKLVSTEGDNESVAIDYLASSGIREHISYTDLHKRSDRVAARLRAIRKNDASPSHGNFIIPTFIAQSPDLYIAQLGILKAGAAFCPLSLDVPEERLRFILQDVDAKVLLTTTSMRQSLPDLENVSIVAADGDSDGNEGLQSQADITATSPAYVMYTSGSTGQPKGVVLSHASATQALLAHQRHIPRFSRFLQFASPTFDVSVFEIFFPFFRRATLVCGDRRRLLSDLPGFINEMNVDAAELTPSVASSLLRGKSGVPSLRALLTIGEMLKRDVVEEFGGSDDQGAILHGMYGPTEATIHCTLQPSFSKDMSVGNIGVPLDTVSAFIVKPLETDQIAKAPEIVPVEEDGELAVGGHQLADGYLNRPEQTQSAFVEHPEYGLLYRTGDRARMTKSGKIECLGRISSGQVKLRGQRIELGEIEYATSKSSGCQSVVAEVVGGTLVVFVTGNTAGVEKAEIFATCRKWLPGYMVPGDVILLESLPYLASGKVDHKALQSIYSQRRDQGTPDEEFVSPRLQTIVETLGSGLSATVTASTQLATTGLDSLSAIRIASQLRMTGMSGLDATSLLEARTPRDIEQAFEISQSRQLSEDNTEQDGLSELRRQVTDLKSVQDLMDDIADIIVPTPVQTEMLSETLQRYGAYCNWVELTLPSVHSLRHVVQCLHHLASHHALLRSGFVSVGDVELPYAMITWKSLLHSQIKQVECFDRSPVVKDEADLMRPVKIQMLQSASETRMLLSIHHALYDQWAVDVFKTDLNTLLCGRSIENAPAFQQLTAMYRDTHATHGDASFDFWQDQLQNFSPTLLPVMRSKRAPPALERTDWQPVGNDIRQLRAAAHEAGCSLPAAYQASLAYLLAAYTGASDVTFGTVFSGRHLPLNGIERLFGPCLSTLPLRVDCNGVRSNNDLLSLVHDRNRTLQKHALLPISKIKSAAGISATIRLFDVLFVWQETTFVIDRSDMAVQEINSADQYDFSLAIEVKPSDDGVAARATYQRNHLAPQQVDLLLQQLSALSDTMLRHPQGLVRELPESLPDAALSLWNASLEHCGPGHDLIRTIERHASEDPGKTALVFAAAFGGADDSFRTLTYRELNARANRLANHLRSLEGNPSAPVCVCMEKSPDLYIAILATLKAGRGYLPLLPDTPAARFASIIAQSDVKLCLCDGDASRRLKKYATLQVVDVTSTDFATFSPDNLPSTISGSDVAYTVFTSGSTGEPKGVAVTAANLLGNLQALAELYQVESGDRLLQACSQAFDVSVFEIFFAFYTGICLCSAPKDVLFADLEAGIRGFGITHLSLTPTVAALIDPDNVQVKFLVTAGEAVTELVHERWAGRGLHQGYGPSETTNICTVNLNAKPDDMLGNIGPPFRNTSAFVLAPGPEFDVLPAGAIGEFAFGGEQVFKGYVGMGTLNAEKIIDHPRFGRVYKSGDIGRILHDGTLLISGRLDDQVKIRGNRIELGEINAALLRDPHVQDCTTITTGETAAEQDLVSFIVPCSTRASTTSSSMLVKPDADIIKKLFGVLEDAVPAYMLPSMIVVANRLPLTTQGKLDRRLLKDLLVDLSSEERAGYAHALDASETDQQWTETERMVANTLANGLSISVSSISRQGSFFGLGLNSLNAVSFAKHLSTFFGQQVNPGLILRNPSISRLARQLERDAMTRPETTVLEHEQLLPASLVEEVSRQFGQEVEDVLPCTPLQEAMVSASASKVSSYCNTSWIEVFGSLQSLKACWQDMVARHNILRTSFVHTDSPSYPVVQVIRAESSLQWTEHQVDSVVDTESLQNSTHRTVSAMAPFSIQVYKSIKGAKLAICMHHAIYDGISMAQLFREIETRYEGEALPPPPSFAEFIKHSRAQSLQSPIDFWSSKLQGLRPCAFPQATTQRESLELTFEAGHIVQQAKLNDYCRRHGITSLAVLQAALVKVLRHAQALTDICIGNVVSGRTVPVDGIETLVAPCFNTIPVRTDLRYIRSNIDLVKHLTQANSESVDFQLSPLRRLQSLSTDPSKRLFDALLLLQPSELELDEQIWQLERDVGSMGLPLVLEISPHDGNLTMTMHHLSSSITSDVAKQLSRAFVTALQNCLDYPSSDLRLSDGEFGEAVRSVLAPAEDSKQANGHVNGYINGQRHEWSPEENVVRDAFAHFAKIKINRISNNTTLYQLGLDSLNAPQIASRVRSRGYAIDASDVLEGLTPSGIATIMGSARPVDESEKLDLQAFDDKYRSRVLNDLRETSDSVLKVRPSTSVQNGMLAQSLNSGGGLYVNHVAYTVPLKVSDHQLQTAWAAVMRKHEFLRAGFYNLQDPQWPFLMILRSSDAVQQPISHGGHMSWAQLEHRAKCIIMDGIQRSPWHVTLAEGVMLLSIHHALYDAEGLQIVLNDLQAALGGDSIGEPIDTDTILASTICAEQQAANSPAAEQFWRTKLENATLVRMPDLNPTSVVESGLAVETLYTSLSLDDIERYCRNNEATIQALGQTVWALLLAAYTGESDITFGIVFSGRNDSPTWQTAFPSVVTLPVKCDTGRPVQSLLHDMVNYNASAQRHRSTPLAEIQRLTGQAGRDMFDTVFVYQKCASKASVFDWPVQRETAAVDYIASMEFEIDPERNVLFRLTYQTARIPPTQGKLMIQQYNMLMSDVVNYEVDVNHASNNKHLSMVAARTPEIPSDVQLMHEFVEQGAATHPDRVAFQFVSNLDDGKPDITRWTYAELDTIANRIANAILDAGARPGSVVALCMDKCPEATFAFVGILKAGCAFLALDPDLPRDRITFILEDSNASALLTAGLDRDLEVSRGTASINIGLEDILSFPKTAPSIPQPSPEDTCYVLYTSGTTGTPKGCEITHENAVQAMLSFQRLFASHWTQDSRWLQFASYWFDVSVLEQFWSWSVGISVVGAPRDVVLEDIPAFIRALNITHIDLTPSLARLVHPAEVPSLWGGVFITGGEALKQEIIDAWGAKHTICNGYGPTEATIGVTMNTFIGADARPSNIGRAFDNVGAYVIGSDGRTPVIRGGVGELCVSGKLVGKGYLNRSELTNKAFPFVPELGQRVYRTGDLARLLYDDSFQFIGRKDTQAKLRGQRLEIEEIDAVIRQNTDNIADVLSLVLKDHNGKETLASFLTCNSKSLSVGLQMDRSDTARSVAQQAKSACEQKLAGYMVPTHIIPLTSVPLTSNKKIDAKRLAKFFETLDNGSLQSLRRNGGARSLTAQEIRIFEVLSSMFPVDLTQTQSNTNLFSMGLSSISAISFARALKNAGFSRASVATIMKNQTIGQLTSVLTDTEHPVDHGTEEVEQAKLMIKAYSQRYLGRTARLLELQPDDIESVTPCTPLQQGLILDSYRSDARPYFNRFEYQLHNVDYDRLTGACRSLVEQTSVLRSSFVALDEGYGQVVRRTSPVPITHTTSALQSFDTLVQEKTQLWLDANSQALTTPCELHVVQVHGSAYLIIHLHHALYDAISYELMLRRLWQIYRGHGAVDTRPSFFEALPYGPLKHTPGLEAFWQRRLHGSNFQPIAQRHQHSEPDPYLKHSVADCVNLERRRQQLGVSHQAMSQALFEVALRQTPSTQQTRSYGIVVSGRSIELEGMDRVLGPMFNTLPQPIHVRPESRLSDHIRSCHEANAETLPLQHTPLRNIRKWAGRPPAEPLFDVLFVFQHAPASDDETDQAIDSLYTAVERPPKAEYPLVCEVELRDDGTLALTLIAQSECLNMAELRELMSKLEMLYEMATSDPDAHLATRFAVEPLEGTADEQLPSHTPDINGVVDFEWTVEANEIRSAVGHIAGLPHGDVDEHISIFSLGLDSIDAVKLASRLRKAGLYLPVSEILRAQTIPGMLRQIQTRDSAVGRKPISKLQELEKSLIASLDDTSGVCKQLERILPATPHQEALITDMMRSDFESYLNHDILQLDPSVDVGRLESAWRMVVDASPLLRTSFMQVADPSLSAIFAQLVHRTNALSIPELHLSNLDDIKEYLDDIRTDVSATLEHRPPFRLALAFVNNQSYLVITLAHCLYDGHSLALLHEDVQRAYTQTFEARPSYDSALEAALDAVGGDSLRFWSTALSGARSLAFPTFTHALKNDETHRCESSSELDVANIRSFCQQQGISMQALAQTCWALTLSHYTHSVEAVFGVVLACRDSEEAERILFPMMNTVVMRASLHGSRTDMLQYMQSSINELLPYQRTPLRSIQKACAEVVETSTELEGSLFDTLFTYQHRPALETAENEALYHSVSASSSVDYPVAVEMEAVGDELVLRAACKSSVLDERGTRQLLVTLGEVLQSIVTHPEKSTVDLRDGKASICGLETFSLRPPTGSQQTNGTEPVDGEHEEADSSPLVRKILEIFSQVSGMDVSALTPSSTIESIGIDSISAIKVASLLRKGDIKLSVSQIIRAKTASRMALIASEVSGPPTKDPKLNDKILGEIIRSIDVTHAAGRAGVEPAHVESALPATAGQVYMLSMWAKASGQIFCPTFTYQLPSGVGQEEVIRAWRALVKRHPILRTIFAVGSDKEHPVLQLVIRDGAFSTQRQPLIDFKPRRTESGEVWELEIHHALYDAVSLPLMIQDLGSLLTGQTLSESGMKYDDFIVTSATQEARKQQREFWIRYLSDMTPIKLPQPAQDGQQTKIDIFQPALYSEVASLDARARKEGLSVQALLFAAYSKVYASYPAKTGAVATDVVLGVYLANRSHLPDLDSLAAPTLNLVPLLVRSPKQRPIVEIATEIREDLQSIGSSENSATALWQIARWTGVKVDTFVNFLRLPESSDGDLRTDDSTKMEEVNDHRTRARREVVEPERRASFELPPGLEDIGKVDGYQHSVDIEMTVMDGKLDVGLFAPVEMLSLEDAERALTQLKGLLEGLVEEGRG